MQTPPDSTAPLPLQQPRLLLLLLLLFLVLLSLCLHCTTYLILYHQSLAPPPTHTHSPSRKGAWATAHHRKCTVQRGERQPVALPLPPPLHSPPPPVLLHRSRRGVGAGLLLLLPFACTSCWCSATAVPPLQRMLCRKCC